jgi:cytochrome c-type biogenesis protein CcmE
MPVTYRGTRPANFKDAISIVAIGRYQDGRIDAEKLLVKCPSKYQGAEVEKAYPASPGAPGKTS